MPTQTSRLAPAAQPVTFETVPLAPPPGSAGPRPLNVAIVDEELPYPPTSGKRLRTLNLTLRLARRHRLTYICHRNSDPAEALRARAFFLEHGIRTAVVDRAVPRKAGLGFYARLALNTLSPLPFSVTTHDSRALRRALVEHAARQAVDLWHCEWTPYAHALRVVSGAPKVVVAHNIEAQVWQRYAVHEPNPFKRLFMRYQMRKFLKFEDCTFAACAAAVAVSREDAALARFAYNAPRVEVVDNGVDTDFFQPPTGQRQPNTVLFLGSLDWRPNLDAVDVLLRQVWPAVRAQAPEARLQIVGRNPPAWLANRVAAESGAELHGSVPDVRPFLTTCGVLAVPLRIAGGSRLRILEALACETPVVATRIGAEGLRLKAGEHLSIVDDCDAMANGLLAALRDPEAMLAQARRGRETVLAEYHWDALATKLEQVWLSCARVHAA
jgi:glycosyltransferase involved in cell wall biosynthesis